MRDVHERIDWANFDLNLLKALDALLAERGVRRAAARCGMTQSGMSHALARLREQLDDPLLVRSGNDMLLSPRAERIGAAVRQSLVEIERVLNDRPLFDPAEAARAFTLACTDAAAVWILPELVRTLERSAPNVELRVVPLQLAAAAGQLERGEIDVALGVALAGSADLRRVRLYSEEFVAVVRRGHPAARAFDRD